MARGDLVLEKKGFSLFLFIQSNTKSPVAMKYFYATILFLFLSSLPCYAQKIDYPIGFSELLEKAGVDFYEPVEAGYKDTRPVSNDYQNYNLAIFSRKENLEIRYVIHPYDANDAFSNNPHIATMRAMTSVATNEEEKLISAIQLDKEEVHEDFNADWGMIYFFTPKPGFSTYPHCRMLALHKEAQATIFIFYLFEKTDNEALDRRYQALGFLDQLEN